MKKIILMGFILLTVIVSTNAQDTSLYKGQCDIYQWSGKVLEQITLWKIDSVRVQYINNGNLSEVLSEDIQGIATNNFPDLR